MSEPTFKHLLAAFAGEARDVADHAEQALRHIRDGNLQAACDVVSVSHYKIAAIETEWRGLMEAFEKAGIKPGQESR